MIRRQMNAATERKILRWLHIILSIPVVGYIYGPVADIPQAAAAVRYVFMPMIVFTGIWMWKGPAIRRLFCRRTS
jgi:thiosulfate reductase cytochrome b subunit